MAGRGEQDAIDRAERERAENWSTIYFGKRDTRTFVPKRNPRQGWTINFGSRGGARRIYHPFGLCFPLGLGLGGVIETVVTQG